MHEINWLDPAEDSSTQIIQTTAQREKILTALKKKTNPKKPTKPHRTWGKIIKLSIRYIIET